MSASKVGSAGTVPERVKRSLREEAGVTLLELMMAFALFAIIFAIGMRAYVTSYAGIITQEQRNQALQLVRGVFSNLRQLRDEPRFEYPDGFFVRYPDGAVVTDVRSPETSALGGQETVRVEYEDPAANPLLVRVIVEWQDPRNRPVTLEVSTLLTAR